MLRQLHVIPLAQGGTAAPRDPPAAHSGLRFRGRSKHLRRLVAGTLCASLVACSSPPIAQPASPLRLLDLGEVAIVVDGDAATRLEDPSAYRHAAARLADVGYRLGTGDERLCRERYAHRIGLVVESAGAFSALGLAHLADSGSASDALRVAHVVRGSAADRVGVRAGDQIVRIGEGAGSAAASLMAALAAVRSAGTPTEISLLRDGQTLHTRVHPARGCAFLVALSSTQEFTWGRNPPLEFARASDDELALALAYEAAHALLRRGEHGARLIDGAGRAVDATLSATSLLLGIATLGGWPAKPVEIFSGPASASQQAAAETAANQLALRLVHAAGYSVTQALEMLLDNRSPQDGAALREEAQRLQAMHRPAARPRPPP